ncbi:uncharacterized protein LOC144151970 [Haemaphysalis longicornis]
MTTDIMASAPGNIPVYETNMASQNSNDAGDIHAELVGPPNAAVQRCATPDTAIEISSSSELDESVEHVAVVNPQVDAPIPGGEASEAPKLSTLECLQAELAELAESSGKADEVLEELEKTFAYLEQNYK